MAMSFFSILAFILPFGGLSLPLGLPPLPEDTMRAVRAIYDRRIRSGVHQRW